MHFKKQQNTDFKRFIMINTDNSMNIFIQGCNHSVTGGIVCLKEGFPTSGNDRTLVIPYVVIPACPESLLSATHH